MINILLAKEAISMLPAIAALILSVSSLFIERKYRKKKTQNKCEYDKIDIDTTSLKPEDYKVLLESLIQRTSVNNSTDESLSIDQALTKEEYERIVQILALELQKLNREKHQIVSSESNTTELSCDSTHYIESTKHQN